MKLFFLLLLICLIACKKEMKPETLGQSAVKPPARPQPHGMGTAVLLPKKPLGVKGN